jgi:hypothetical protein
VLAVALFHLGNLLPPRQRALRACELVTGPGFIEIKNAGVRSQRIDAKSIIGGTTARTARGVLFTLSHVRRDQPIAIEVESDADADRVRHALGIGHGGFGTVGWQTMANQASKAGFWGNLLTFLIGVFVVGLGFFVSHEAAGIAGLITGNFALLTIILGLVGLFGRKGTPSVTMTAEGLKIQTKQGWFTVPYGDVQGIEPVKGALRFTVPAPYFSVDVEAGGTLMGAGLGPDDREGLIKQIMSASARARGLGAAKNDVTGRVDVLRRNGESPRDWLARLDMAGRMLNSTAAGYRGHTLEPDDLWTVLEDPEAEGELRAAAARVLRHTETPEARLRIDAAVAAVRDESVNRRLRIAIRDDVDGASQELAVLDAQEGEGPPPGARAMQLR